MPPKRTDPIRCFEGTTKPHEAFWKVRNAAETGGDPEMELYGYISEYSWFEDDVTPKMFKNALYSLGNGGPITVRLNSGGGDVIAASVIRSIMTDYPGDITVRIDGLAASAAVIVAMAGKKVRIMDTAYMMIHDPAYSVLFATLDIALLEDLWNTLTSIKKGIVETYAAKTGLKQDKLAQMMADTTWMSASEAVEYGFANEIIEGGQAPAASNMAVVNALRNYVNVPAALLDLRSGPIDQLPVQPLSPEMLRLQAEVKMVLS